MYLVHPSRRVLFAGSNAQRVAHANAFQHEHAVVDFDLAFRLCDEAVRRRGDPARLQRATEGAG